MVIKINYTSSDIYVSTNVSPVYVVVNYSAVNNGSGVAWGAITGTLSSQTDLQTALDTKVPYTGAITNVDLGEYELKAGQVEFDQTPTGAIGAAVMRWNDSDGTVDLGLKGGNVTLQVGQEQVIRVVNKTGVNLLESQYRAVRIRLVSEGGSQGQRLAVVLAQGDNDPDSTTTIGIVTENIDNNQEGFITTSGEVRGINTTGSLQGETWVDGDIIYLSPTIPGGITKVKPIAPNHLLQLGYVIYAHNVNGKIFVKVDNGYELSELHDVYAPSPTDGQGIFWNTANLRYQNNTVAGILGYTPLSGSGATGQVAYWNGASSQTGSNNLFWNSANNNLGIGSNNVNSGFKLGVNGDIVVSGGSPFVAFNTATSSGSTPAYIQFINSTSIFNIVSTGAIDFYSNANNRMRLFATSGNLSIGGGSTPTDSGQRLQVYGDAFIKGSGATSATNALLVQNSAGLPIFAALNNRTTYFSSSSGYDGTVEINTLANRLAKIGFFEFTAGSGANWTGTGIRVDGNNRCVTLGLSGANTTDNNALIVSMGGSGGQGFSLRTSGIIEGALFDSFTFAPTSGTATFAQFVLRGTINQTGGANGITRGLYVNPTLTAAADWRAIEWSNNSGWGLYGAGTANNYLGGNLGIGTTSPAFRLDVRSNVNAVEGFAIANSNTGTGAATSFQIGQTPTSSPFNAMYITNFGSGWSSGGLANTNSMTSGSGSTGGLNIVVDGLNAPLRLFTNDGSTSEKMRLNASGALGLRSTIPSTLSSSNAFAFIGKSGAISAATGANDIGLSNNGYFNGTNNIYKNDGIASSIFLNSNGNIEFYNAPNGTAGTTLSFTQRMTLTAAGRLLLGTTSESTFLLDVNGTARVSGNMAIGTSLSTWGAGTFALEIGQGTSLWNPGGAGFSLLLTNAYNDGTNFRYKSGTIASRYQQDNTGHFWSTAPSGTAGNVITFTQRMTLTTTGSLLLGTISDNSSAILNLESTTRGFLPPKMNTTQKGNIASPTAGLMVFDTTLVKLCVYNGTAWETITSI